MRVLLTCVLAACVKGGEFGVRFVAALGEYGGYRESHASACTREGLRATASNAYLGINASSAVAWDVAGVLRAVAAIGASPSTPVLSGCCSSTLFCVAGGPNGSLTECRTHGLGGVTYDNVGWTLTSYLIPVYTCEATPNAWDDVPWVGNAFARRDVRYRPSNFPRLVIDGQSLGRSTRDLAITVAGAPCTNVAMCGSICRACLSDKDCANGQVCMGAGSQSVCMLPCEDSLICPCGAVCYSISIQGTATRANLCLAPGLVTSSSLCDGATGLFTPPLPFLDRAECDPPRGVYGQDLMPVSTGSGRLRAGILGSVRARERTPARELQGLTLSEVVGTAGLLSSSATAVEENWGGGLGGRARLLQPGWRGMVVSAAPLSGNGYRYTSVSNASVAFPVIVTRLGFASTGLGVPAYERIYQASPYPRPSSRTRRLSDASMVPFWDLTCVEPGESCAYLGSVPSWLNAPPSSCYTSAAGCPASSRSCDCPIIDACSRPTCVPLNGPSGSAGAGVCEYSPSGACDSSSTPLLRPGELPTVSMYVPLPPAVSSVVAMPPPPRSNLSRPGAGVIADPSVRDPALFDGAISWAPSSAWYDPSSLPGNAVFASRPGSLSTDYALQAAVSSSDDGPMSSIPLRARMTLAPEQGLLVNRTATWDFPFFGPATNASVTRLYLSPNGYLRVVATNACSAEAAASGAAATFCSSFDTDYAGVIAPFIADLNPGQYAMAEIFTAQFDASPIAIATLNGSSLALPPDFTVPLTLAELAAFAAAVPAVYTLCATTYNTGLFESSPRPPPLLPPSPAYNTHLCISGDGSIRWRNGAVFGSTAYRGGSWNSETVVPASVPYLPEASWIAGVRSLSTAWDNSATDSWVSNPRRSSSGNAEPFATTYSGYAELRPRDDDVALQGTTQLISSAAGMRPGATTALCAMGATACASPACGLSGGGTTVTITWAGMGCGLGFEALLPAILLAPSNLRSAAPSPQTARIECLFGQASVPATWLSYDVLSAVGRLTCVSPPLGAATGGVYNGSGSIARVRLPLRLQVVVPASLAAIVAGGAGVVTGAGRVPQGRAPDEWARSQGWGDEDGAYDPATGMLTLPLKVHGLVATVVGAMLQQAAVVPIPLFFAYSDSSQSCGCARLGAVDVCDSCGVCGGDGLSRDCTGTCMGKAVIDSCGICSGGATNQLPNADMDCNGICFGPGTGCSSPPANPVEPVPSDSILNTIFYLFIIITPSMLCSSMILWFAYSFFISPFVHAREDEDTIRVLVAGRPEDLGLSGGLSTEQLSRIAVLPWSEFGAGLVRFDPQCCICMDDFVKDVRVNRLASCGHVFHVDCLHTWLARSTLCPVCRADQRLDGEIAAATELRRLRATEIIHSPPPHLGRSPVADDGAAPPGSVSDAD